MAKTTWDRLAQGDREGYCVDNRVPRPADGPNYNQWDEKKATLVHHLNQIMQEFDDNGLAVTDITIGKTFGRARKRRGAPVPVVSTDPRTWTMGGLTARWGYYKKKGYQALVVLECVDRHDIPGNLQALDGDQEDLALLVEKALVAAKNQIHSMEQDAGGGGRVGRNPAACYFIYAAFKLQPIAFDDGETDVGSDADDDGDDASQEASQT